jgi:hypothetical protein
MPAAASTARDARQHNEGAYGGNQVSPVLKKSWGHRFREWPQSGYQR